MSKREHHRQHCHATEEDSWKQGGKRLPHLPHRPQHHSNGCLIPCSPLLAVCNSNSANPLKPAVDSGRWEQNGFCVHTLTPFGRRTLLLHTWPFATLITVTSPISHLSTATFAGTLYYLTFTYLALAARPFHWCSFNAKGLILECLNKKLWEGSKWSYYRHIQVKLAVSIDR